MIAWTKNTKLYQTSFLISVIILLISVNVVSQVKGSELNGDLSFSLSRDFGISFGNYRQGTFTLTGEGVESIVKLTVFLMTLMFTMYLVIPYLGHLIQMTTKMARQQFC